MFNFSLYPYARWLSDGSLDDVPGFNIGESEVPPGNGGFRRRNVCSAADATISELAANAGVNGGTGGLRQRLSVDSRNGRGRRLCCAGPRFSALMRPIESAQRGARYRTASGRLILIPDATRLSPHTARLRKTPGRPRALLGAGARPISKTPL
jgi:hypothetical protein